MSDIHIDDFYKDAARMLLQLYRAFPRKTLILVEDFIGPDTPDEYGLHSVRHQSCFSAAIWLAEAGYLTYQDHLRQEGIDQAVLTHKGFTLMTAPALFLDESATPPTEDLPSSVAESHRSNAFRLQEAVKSGSSKAIRDAMQGVMQQSLDH